MTNYLVECNNQDCKNQFEVDEPPPSNAKPRENPEDLEPAGTLKTTTGQNAKCPKCDEIGAHPIL